MKKSLLLIGLTMCTGLAASAQAATAVHRSHAQNAGAGMLVAASGYDNGLFSALDNLISGDTQTRAGASSACSCRHDTQADHAPPMPPQPPQPPLPPGPGTAPPMTGATTAPSDTSNNATAERQTPASGGGQIPVETRSDLGWQSLLPGSIQ